MGAMDLTSLYRKLRRPAAAALAVVLAAAGVALLVLDDDVALGVALLLGALAPAAVAVLEPGSRWDTIGFVLGAGVSAAALGSGHLGPTSRALAIAALVLALVAAVVSTVLAAERADRDGRSRLR